MPFASDGLGGFPRVHAGQRGVLVPVADPGLVLARDGAYLALSGAAGIGRVTVVVAVLACGRAALYALAAHLRLLLGLVGM